MDNADKPKFKDINIDINKPLYPQLANVPEENLKQLLAQANNMATMSQGQMMIQGVVDEIKEIPILPSEVPKDSNPILEVQLPNEGGVLTFMKNFEYPYKGFPFFEFVDKIDTLKKLGRSILSGLYHEVKAKNKLWFITLLPGMWIAKDAFRASVYGCYRVVERFRIKQKYYCIFIRELHRAFSVSDPNERVKEVEFRQYFRDVVCMILEMDNAYRYRAQDVLVELDKGKLKQNPSKEISRILGIMQEREKDQKLKDTWTLLLFLIKFYVKFDKNLNRFIVNGLLELDLEKVALDIGDKVFCVARKDYTFGFQLNPTVEEQKLIDKNLLYERFLTEKDGIVKESNNAHQDVIKKYTPASPENRDKFVYEMGKLDEKYEKLLKTAEEQYAQARAKI